MTSDYADTRAAFLFFTIIGWIGSMGLYVFVMLNIVHYKFFDKLPWILIVN